MLTESQEGPLEEDPPIGEQSESGQEPQEDTLPPGCSKTLQVGCGLLLLSPVYFVFGLAIATGNMAALALHCVSGGLLAIAIASSKESKPPGGPEAVAEGAAIVLVVHLLAFLFFIASVVALIAG